MEHLETGSLGDAGVWDTLVIVAREKTGEVGSSEQEIWHMCQRTWTLSRDQRFASSSLLDRLYCTSMRDCQPYRSWALSPDILIQ